MRIVYVTPRYRPYRGGIERAVEEVAVRLSARGYEVLVVTTDPSGRLPRREVLEGVEVRRLRSIAPGDSYYLSLGLYRELERSEGDILHAHSFHALPSLVAARAKGSRRLVVSPHYHGHAHTPFRETLFQVYKRTALKTIVSASDRILCVSEYERTLVQRDFPESAPKTLVIPNGIDRERLRKVKWHPRADGLKILYVGRIEAYKNLDKAIEAVRVLRERGWDARLTIVGRGPHKPQLRRMAERIGVDELIEWKEDLTEEELYEEYSSSNVFLLLSTDEAFGIAAVEAMTIGLPTVLARAAALSTYVEEGLALGVDPPFDPEAVADRILEASSGWTPDRRRIQRRFLSWDEVVDRLEEVYQALRG
ncbi:glycosyltransferase family 4 protein [Candidatus Bathyarchaeota archaeon]|nr:glycosyltransferase family 4 protein [Candidatus Bathyarchaeota archaeon]